MDVMTTSKLLLKDHLSDFGGWDQEHMPKSIYFIKGIMGFITLCIDGAALSKRRSFIPSLNKQEAKQKGRKGSSKRRIRGTKTDDIICWYLTEIPQELRNQVKEITLDMAGEHAKITKTYFPRTMQQVIDRFHVQKLVYEAVQELRITYRWQSDKGGE